MPVFAYKALDLDASAVGGTIIADTPRQARDVLRGRGLTITQVRSVSEGTRLALFARRRGRRAEAEVITAVQELATLLGAGIPLLAALDTLLKQHRGRFRTVLQGVRDEVAAGASLADALGERPAYFDELAVSIVRVGESTGTLEASLAQLADFKEEAQHLRSRVATALLYPAIVSIVGLAVGTFLMTYVVPNLLSALTETGKDLPAVTRLVKGASDFLLGWWWAILAVLTGLAAGGRLLASSDRGRLVLDRLLLAVPVLGDLVRKENTSRMAVVLAALGLLATRALSSGAAPEG